MGTSECARTSTFPPQGVAGEYKSRRFHPEDTWTNDDRRMDALAAEGLTTFSLNNERTRSLKELSAVGLMVAKRLNLRRHAPTPEQLKARRALHTMLFSTREFDGDEPPGGGLCRGDRCGVSWV